MLNVSGLGCVDDSWEEDEEPYGHGRLGVVALDNIVFVDHILVLLTWMGRVKARITCTLGCIGGAAGAGEPGSTPSWRVRVGDVQPSLS